MLNRAVKSGLVTGILGGIGQAMALHAAEKKEDEVRQREREDLLAGEQLKMSYWAAREGIRVQNEERLMDKEYGLKKEMEKDKSGNAEAPAEQGQTLYSALGFKNYDDQSKWVEDNFRVPDGEGGFVVPSKTYQYVELALGRMKNPSRPQIIEEVRNSLANGADKSVLDAIYQQVEALGVQRKYVTDLHDSLRNNPDAIMGFSQLDDSGKMQLLYQGAKELQDKDNARVAKNVETMRKTADMQGELARVDKIVKQYEQPIAGQARPSQAEYAQAKLRAHELRMELQRGGG